MSTRPVNGLNIEKKGFETNEDFPKKIKLDKPYVNLENLEKSVNTKVTINKHNYAVLISDETFIQIAKIVANIRTADLPDLEKRFQIPGITSDSRFLELNPIGLGVTLVKAAKEGNEIIVNGIMDSGILPKIALEYFTSGFMEAVENGKEKIVEIFTECPWYADIPEEEINKALATADAKGHKKIISTMIQKMGLNQQLTLLKKEGEKSNSIAISVIECADFKIVGNYIGATLVESAEKDLYDMAKSIITHPQFNLVPILYVNWFVRLSKDKKLHLLLSEKANKESTVSIIHHYIEEGRSRWAATAITTLENALRD